MSLLDKLTAGEASAQSLNGSTPSIPNFEISTLHNQYSTIGQPNAAGVIPPNGVLPMPSSLEANIQEGDKYLNNLPN